MASESDATERYHHGDLRRALLDAALELIESDGVAGLSLRAIARRAGVSHAAPYHHFPDRAALVAAVAEEGFMFLRAAMLDRMSPVGDPRGRFREAGVAYVLFALRHPAHFRVMFSTEVADKAAYPSLESAAQAAHEVLVAAIIEGQDAGVIREGDAQMIGRAAWSLVHGLATLTLNGHFGPVDPTSATAESLANAVAGWLWKGVGADISKDAV